MTLTKDITSDYDTTQESLIAWVRPLIKKTRNLKKVGLLGVISSIIAFILFSPFIVIGLTPVFVFGTLFYAVLNLPFTCIFVFWVVCIFHGIDTASLLPVFFGIWILLPLVYPIIALVRNKLYQKQYEKDFVGFATKTLQLNEWLYRDYKDISHLEAILEKTASIHDMILPLKNLLNGEKLPGEKKTFLPLYLKIRFPKKSKNAQDTGYILSETIRDALRKELHFLFSILKDLRSDLISSLSEQKRILKSAKTEVTENIKWSTELEKVSEVQKVRLDKQIEQFEELQKVLVKV